MTTPFVLPSYHSLRPKHRMQTWISWWLCNRCFFVLLLVGLNYSVKYQFFLSHAPYSLLVFFDWIKVTKNSIVCFYSCVSNGLDFSIRYFGCRTLSLDTGHAIVKEFVDPGLLRRMQEETQRTDIVWNHGLILIKPVERSIGWIFYLHHLLISQCNQKHI